MKYDINHSRRLKPIEWCDGDGDINNWGGQGCHFPVEDWHLDK